MCTRIDRSAYTYIYVDVRVSNFVSLAVFEYVYPRIATYNAYTYVYIYIYIYVHVCFQLWFPASLRRKSFAKC